ncbi:50S ribosomal protein L17 [Enterococcus termitis]|nr:50S ribosomal protein L17 [Enterococcus termitis]
MLRDLTTDLIINERIVTTEARAKEIRSTTEKMITLGKRGDLHARRQAATFVRNEVASVREENEAIVVESALQKLFNDLAPRYAERQGGYTRILKTEPRRGDAAPMVIIEFVK